MFCNGTSYIKGVHRLTHKESNRAESIKDMCRRFGADIAVQEDDMIIKGGSALKAATVHPFNDHRIAMAAAIIAMNIEDETMINDAECVNKSYPGFWRDIEKLGTNIITPPVAHR
jgi:3-phosphoshikimate 1-carboxyvinyltransferase